MVNPKKWNYFEYGFCFSLDCVLDFQEGTLVPGALCLEEGRPQAPAASSLPTAQLCMHHTKSYLLGPGSLLTPLCPQTLLHVCPCHLISCDCSQALWEGWF